MWNPNYPQGITLADAQENYHVGGGGGIPSSLLNQHQHNPGLAIAALVGQFIADRQRDKMANQILAVDNAPKAQAVDPNVHADTTKYTPDTALTKAMMDQNLAGGFPVTPSPTPDLGGWDGLQLHDQITKQLQDQDKANLDNQLTQARIDRINHPVFRATAAPTAPDDSHDGKTYVDGIGWVKSDLVYKAKNPAAPVQKLPPPPAPDTIESLSKDLQALTGHPFGDWAGAVNKHMGQNIPGKPGWFGTSFGATPAQHIDDGMFHATIPRYDKTGRLDLSKAQDLSIPADLYQKMIERRNALDRPPTAPVAGTATAPAGTPVQPNSDGAISRTDLAMEALNDPDATPEEKAQARRILAGEVQ